MKVNMTPNPLDVVTIHASQGDTEARQWEFELHNNGELIDTSEVTDQITFKAYEGGTEQLLPENGSTPTTSPFLGDIRYPHGLLTDQEFTYRESPTEEDGLAKITDIKGNTSVWNQNCYGFSVLRSTLSSTINSQTDITCTASSGQTSFGIIIRDNAGNFNFISGHTYLLSMNISEINVNNFSRISPESTMNPQDLARGTGRYATVCTPTASGPKSILCYLSGTTTTSDKFKFNSVQIVDLTMLNDSRITDLNSFKTFYPLPYYAYNQGTLLSFMGNGIKTVGFNQWDEEWESGRINADGTKAPSSTYIRSKNYIHIFPNTTYYRKSPNNIQPFYYDGNMNFISYGLWGANSTFATPNNAEYMLFYIDPKYGTTYKNDICINISDPSKNGTYEPYTSSTLSLPISTYFSNGMKSAGSVYDELTETKAITRIGSVDLGTLTYVREAPASGHPDWPIFYANVPNALGRYGTYGNTQICAKYSNRSSNLWQDKTIGFGANSTNINIADTTFTDYTVDQVKQALSGVILYYQLATESETSFTTASLVTENAEIPLSNEDGVLIGKCTEELSAEPGFIDAKIKLTDSDGTCYSNKLQLHVERSPQ